MLNFYELTHWIYPVYYLGKYKGMIRGEEPTPLEKLILQKFEDTQMSTTINMAVDIHSGRVIVLTPDPKDYHVYVTGEITPYQVIVFPPKIEEMHRYKTQLVPVTRYENENRHIFVEHWHEYVMTP